MTEKVNFQWQNDHLLRTIYPLREMKLRDFLVYYREFELWAEHKDKSLQDPDMRVAMLELLDTLEDESRHMHAAFHRTLAYFKQDTIAFREANPDLRILSDYIDKLVWEHNGFQQNFFKYDSTRKQGYYLENFVMRLEGFQARMKKDTNDLNRNLRNYRITDPTNVRIQLWEKELEIKQNTLDMINSELDKLYELVGAFNRIKGDLDLILVHLGRRGTLGLKESQESTELREHNPERVVDFLRTARTRKRVRIEDIVLSKVQQYEDELESLDHEELIERIVNHFLDRPTAHELWLQYMVIHFSGMRYQSAHGSWGDPKDLLISLKIKAIHDKLANDSDEIIQAEAAIEAGILRGLPDAGSRERQRQISALESLQPYLKRRALQDVWIDKKQQMIESMSDEQVLKALEAMSAQLPPWMWKEIVARTDLRLAYAGANWESLTEEDKAGYYDRINAEFRDILVKWKAENLTMWREEHASGNRLIVTRAVCNEVAEHIQHLRGVKPPGGLTAKPLWYRNEQKAGKLSPAGEKPYFGKISSSADFRPGSSILWVNWVRGKPNIWRITHPLELEGGEGLLPAGLVQPNARRELQAQRKKLKAGGKAPWVVEMVDDGYRRSHYVASQQPKPNNPKQLRWVVSEEPEEQWMRWMHEATIVASGQTAEGQVVLTFETALPYEDPRRSTIGVFKRYAGHLYYNVNEDYTNGTFVGYMPQGEIPVSNLKVMLDWRKIAPGMNIPQDRIDRFWREIEESLRLQPGELDRPEKPVIPADEPRVWVEAAPPFSTKDREFTLCFVLVPDRARPGKFKDEVAKPRLELRRGLQLEVSKTDRVEVGRDRYARIVHCEEVPGAAGLYAREAEVLELPAESRSLPVRSKGAMNVRALNKINEKGKPLMLPAGIKFVADTMLRVSLVHHRLSDPGTGPGQVDADGNDDYYLVVECPSRPVAEGLFVKVNEVEVVDEATYEAGKLSGASDPDSGKPMRATVTPEENELTAALFKTAADATPQSPDFDRVWQTLPKEEVVTIGKMEITKSGKVFYPILSYEADPGLEGFFIRRKEIEILPAAE